MQLYMGVEWGKGGECVCVRVLSIVIFYMIVKSCVIASTILEF